MIVTDLRCEYLTNPLGLTSPGRGLSWEMRDARRGARQSAYQIQVAPASRRCTRAQPIYGQRQGCLRSIVHVAYAGKALGSGQRAWWRCARVDAATSPRVERGGVVGDGLLERAAWQGQWIGAMLAGGPYPCHQPGAVRAHAVHARPAGGAGALYATALGLYEPHLNGQVVGDDVVVVARLDRLRHPGSNIKSTIVTLLAATGRDVLGAALGDGWYCGLSGWTSASNTATAPGSSCS